MPYLPDGSPVEVVLNPLGVPSRMNVGRSWRPTWLGGLALGLRVASPVFDGAAEKDIKALLKRASCAFGKTVLYDGRRGSRSTRRWRWLHLPHEAGHRVDDKIHARSIARTPW